MILILEGLVGEKPWLSAWWRRQDVEVRFFSRGRLPVMISVSGYTGWHFQKGGCRASIHPARGIVPGADACRPSLSSRDGWSSG